MKKFTEQPLPSNFRCISTLLLSLFLLGASNIYAATIDGAYTYDIQPSSVNLVAGQSQSVFLTISDENGPVSGLSTSWVVDAYDNAIAATLESAAVITSQNGVARNHVTITGTDGYAAIRVTVPGEAEPLYIPLSVDSNEGNNQNDPYDRYRPTVEVVSGDAQSGFAGQAATESLVARFSMQGSPLANESVTWQFNNGIEAITRTDTTNQNGEVTAEVIYGQSAGPQTVVAYLPSYESAATFNLFAEVRTSEESTVTDNPEPTNEDDRVTIATEADDIAEDANATFSSLRGNLSNAGQYLTTACRDVGDISSRTQSQEDLFQHCLDVMRDASNGLSLESETALSQLAPEAYLAIGLTDLQTLANSLTKTQRRLYELRHDQRTGIDIQELNFLVDDEILPMDQIKSLIPLDDENATNFGNILSPWSGYVSGSVVVAERDMDSSQLSFELSVKELVFGADYRISKRSAVGGVFTLSGSDNVADDSKGDIVSSAQLITIYGTHIMSSQWYIDGLLSYGRSTSELDRQVNYTSNGNAVSAELDADTDSSLFNIALSVGKDFNRGAWIFSPIVTLDVAQVTVGEFTESSDSADDDIAMTIEEHDVTSTRLSFGSDVSYAISTSHGVYLPQAKLSLAYETNSDAHELEAGFAEAPSSSRMTLEADEPESFYAELLLGTSATLSGGKSVNVFYNTVIGNSNYSSHHLSAGFRWEF